MRLALSRLIGTAAALGAAAVSVAAPASASAQELPPMTWNPTEMPIILIAKAIVGQPPCTPDVPVPTAVNCAFDTTVWGLDKAQWAVLTAQYAFNQQVAQAQATATQVTQTVDDAEKLAVGTVCTVLGIPPEECPAI